MCVCHFDRSTASLFLDQFGQCFGVWLEVIATWPPVGPMSATRGHARRVERAVFQLSVGPFGTLVDGLV